MFGAAAGGLLSAGVLSLISATAHYRSVLLKMWGVRFGNSSDTSLRGGKLLSRCAHETAEPLCSRLVSLRAIP